MPRLSAQDKNNAIDKFTKLVSNGAWKLLIDDDAAEETSEKRKKQEYFKIRKFAQRWQDIWKY
jgi:hypothetical protein